jgi:hypothetical protein
MNKTQSIIAASILLVAAAQAASAADSVTVFGKVRGAAKDPVRQATEACLQRFVDAIMPGSSTNVRMITEAGTPTTRLESPGTHIDVQMSATRAGNNKPLASGNCTADLRARVHRISTTVLDPTQLAGLTAHDIRVAATRR